jgi:hypothetical protein
VCRALRTIHTKESTSYALCSSPTTWKCESQYLSGNKATVGLFLQSCANEMATSLANWSLLFFSFFFFLSFFFTIPSTCALGFRTPWHVLRTRNVSYSYGQYVPYPDEHDAMMHGGQLAGRITRHYPLWKKRSRYSPLGSLKSPYNTEGQCFVFSEIVAQTM